MDKIVIEICPGKRAGMVMLRFPELSSPRPFINRALEILKKSAPRFVRYLSMQRTLGHLRDYPIVLRTPPGLDRETALQQFQRWIRGKRNRRLAYVLGEALLIVPATLAALLPGPNVIGYLLVVLLYFHLRALLHLVSVRIGQLDIRVEPAGAAAVECAGG